MLRDAEVHSRLEPLARKTSPVTHSRLKTNAPPTWVEPQLVCEVRFADWTSEGLMRQPVFMGLREEIDPRQGRREQPVSVKKAQERQRYLKKSAKLVFPRKNSI